MKAISENMQNTLFKGVVLGVFVLLGACTQKKVSFKNGVWRAALERSDGHSVIFNFEVKDSAGHKTLDIYNAEGHLQVDSIVRQGDSLFIQMPFFDSHFAIKIEEEGTKLSGTWIKPYSDHKETMPFSAVHGDRSRLKAYADPNYDISGSWETTFLSDEIDYRAIGLFKQDGAQVTGTFLTPFGDFRYLQGVVSGDTLKLSGFDGSHVMLFTAQIEDSTQLKQGEMFALNADAKDWQAKKRKYDSLPARYGVNTIPEGTIKPHFKLKEMKTGDSISLSDDRYRGKVVILDIMGSWCPNCYDETPFLIDFYKKNKDRGLEIISLDFERTIDYEASKKALSSFLSRFDIEYPVLFTGISSTDRKLTEKLFPELPVKIEAFPTLIFIDKFGYIRKIHSGFNGPATGKYYEQFKTEFNSVVNGLLAE